MENQMKTRTLNLGLVSLGLTVLTFAGVHSAHAQQIVTNVAAPSGLDLCAVNPALNKIYFASGNPAAEQMVVVDGATFSQTGVGFGQGVDVDITNNNYWSAGVYSDSATVWNSSNTALGSAATGSGCAIGVSVDAPHRRVWVGAQCSDSLWAFNADTHALIAGPISPGGVMGPPLVNPATDRVYFNAGSSKRVNPSTFGVSANAFGTVIGANASANLLYAVNSTTLQIINGAPDPEVVLTNITLPYTFGSRIGVNPVLNRIYVGYNSTNIVAVLNATTGQGIGNVSLGAGITSVGNIVVDASRNRVYVLASGGGSARLFVIQDTAAQVLTNVAAPSGLDLCAVNPALNKIYFASGNPAAEQMVVVDGATFSQTGVGFGQGVDVDITNNNYWSAGVYSDSATVWNSSNTALGSTGTGSGCAIGVSVDAPHRRVWVGRNAVIPFGPSTRILTPS